jgi:hypothetical protein
MRVGESYAGSGWDSVGDYNEILATKTRGRVLTDSTYRQVCKLYLMNTHQWPCRGKFGEWKNNPSIFDKGVRRLIGRRLDEICTTSLANLLFWYLSKIVLLYALVRGTRIILLKTLLSFSELSITGEPDNIRGLEASTRWVLIVTIPQSYCLFACRLEAHLYYWSRKLLQYDECTYNAQYIHVRQAIYLVLFGPPVILDPRGNFELGVRPPLLSKF